MNRALRNQGRFVRVAGKAAREGCEPGCCIAGRCDGSDIPEDPQEGVRCCDDACGIPDRRDLRLTADITASTSTIVQECGFGGGAFQKDQSSIHSTGSRTWTQEFACFQLFVGNNDAISVTDDNGFCSRFGGNCSSTALQCHPTDLTEGNPRRLTYDRSVRTYNRVPNTTFDCGDPFVRCSPGIPDIVENVQTFSGAIVVHVQRNAGLGAGLRRNQSSCDADSFHSALLAFEVYYRPSTSESFWAVRLDLFKPFDHLEHINPAMTASVETVVHGCLSGVVIRAQASSDYELDGQFASAQASVCLDLSTNVSSCLGGASRAPDEALGEVIALPFATATALDDLRSRGLVRM